MCRAAGFGLRANLPMFGLLGIDWGYGFDPVPTGQTECKSLTNTFYYRSAVLIK